MSEYEPTPPPEDHWAAPSAPETIERTPPHDLLAEQSVLGACMLSARVLPEVLDMLRGVDFYEPKHETIFDAITTLASDGSSVDAITVGNELSVSGKLREIPQGLAYLHELTEVVPTATNAGFYAEIVAERAQRRRLIEFGEAAARSGYDGGDPADQIESLRVDLEGVLGERTVELRTIGSVSKAVRESMATPPSFIETPWPEINSLMGGLRPGSLDIVAARPGAGKTIAGLQIAAKLAEHGPVVFSALEMSIEQLNERLVAMKGQISMSSISRHDLSHVEVAQWGLAEAAIDRLPIYVDDRSGVNVMQVKAFARAAARKAPLAGVVVDYLQLISSHDRRMPVHEMVGEIARQLKILARELNCPVIVLSQLNRESVQSKTSKTGQRPPTLADLSKSDAIGHHADAVLMLQRRLEHDGEPGDTLDMFLVKNRHGNIGRRSLKFEGKFARIVSKPIGLF